MKLQQRYSELLLKSSFPEADILKYWTALEKIYSQKSRHYHNLNHLKEMIICFEEYQSELHFPDEVLYAIFYHDYIYNSTRKDNESKSAEFAIQILPEHSTLNKERISKLILATKNHQCGDNEDEKWLIDFDLKILSKDWDNYITYFQQIRKEYSIYPDLLYNPGRKKTLQHFLEHDYIYQTDAFRTKYETKARENIQKEINLL